MIQDQATKVMNLVTSPPMLTILRTWRILLKAHITQRIKTPSSPKTTVLVSKMMFLHTQTPLAAKILRKKLAFLQVYFADLEDDDYSADAELDPTNESIYESEEDIESAGDMNCSRGDDYDATYQRDYDQMNIRDIFFTDLEANYSSDTDFDPAADSAAESKVNMEDNSEGSNGSSDEESDATVKLDLNNMGIPDLFYLDFEDDSSSDEEFDDATETTNDSGDHGGFRRLKRCGFRLH